MKKRIFCVLLCAIVLMGLLPIAALTASAIDAEGDWTTFRFANDYCDDSCDHDADGDVCYYRPEAGYKYTAEGFTVVPADYIDYTPQLSVMSKEVQSIKDGIYLQFRVDDYSYDGGNGTDQWMAFTLTTEGKVCPGSLNYGGGWMSLIRGKGDGSCVFMPHLTDPATEDFRGTFTNAGMVVGAAPLDEDGREIYTLEITWDGAAYEMKINGTPLPGSNETTALLEKLNPSGEFFVGIQMHSAVKNGTAGLTILKYGTNADDATTPVGSDSKEKEQDCIYCPGPSDPLGVPAGSPAILWNPETTNMKEGYNSTFEVLGDNAWHVRATDSDVFFNFPSKRTVSFLAEDFPVFGILLRNFWGDSGTLWYSAGNIASPTAECTIPFSIYDGEFYGEREEYVFVPVDLTDLWEGRINNIRLDFVIGDERAREFDICFAGMFRSEDEAYAYATDWLACCKGYYPETRPDTEPPVEWVTDVYVSTEIATEAATVTREPDTAEVTPADTENVYQALQGVMVKYGCSGTLAYGGILMMAVACRLMKKKES